MAEKDQTNRWRCTVAGCNPVLVGEASANAHRDDKGHRIAKWPIRSKAGKKKSAVRNRTGYYDKYNVGAKSYEERGHRFDPDYDEVMENRGQSNLQDAGYDTPFIHDFEDDHIFSGEALGQE
jgi:hypothetical protein